MSEPPRGRKIVEINRRVIGPQEPRLKKLVARRIDDYPNLPAVYRDVARQLSSPLRMGPPVCDELIAFVRHLLTEEEAGVARHLGLYRGRTAAQVARAEHRPVEQVQPILDLLSNEKRVIFCSTKTDQAAAALYRLPPIVPGIFEMTLFSHTPESLGDWHRRFIELFEALYETGFSVDYQEHVTPAVRYLPVGKAIEAHPMALPTDRLEVVLDQFQDFGVGQCQCRMAMQVLGQGCGKPLGNCMAMGQWAERGIEEGLMRRVSRKEALEIKREAESHGMVNWMMNVQNTKSQCSCSCCGCCCHALRMINEFNCPGSIAPPHFLPRFDAEKCTYCGRCAAVCPMGAITVRLGRSAEPLALADRPVHDPASEVAPDLTPYRHARERCIGCGLCALACDRQHALAMEPVPDYQLPYRSWYSLVAHALPGVMRTSWNIWRRRGY